MSPVALDTSGSGSDAKFVHGSREQHRGKNNRNEGWGVEDKVRIILVMFEGSIAERNATTVLMKAGVLKI